MRQSVFYDHTGRGAKHADIPAQDAVPPAPGVLHIRRKDTNTMDMAIIQNAATQYHWLIGLLGVVLVLPWWLHAQRNRRGWRSWELRGLLWSVRVTPHEITAQLDGLRALQRALFALLRSIWRLAHPALRAALWEWVKHWLGWS